MVRYGRLKRRAASRVVRVSILLSSLLTFVTPAWSGITYDYAQDWIFDSASGLYWQTQQIPTATFVPASGTIATDQQLSNLWADAGLNSAYPLYGSTPVASGSFSPQLANLLSFFESDTPSLNPLRPNSSLSVAEIYDYRVTDPPPLNYEYAYLTYSSPSQANYSFFGTTTIGDYGPAIACPNAPCPAFEPAFVVSATPPVPLPASVWLFLSGICACVIQRHSQPITGRRRSFLI